MTWLELDPNARLILKKSVTEIQLLVAQGRGHRASSTCRAFVEDEVVCFIFNHLSSLLLLVAKVGSQDVEKLKVARLHRRKLGKLLELVEHVDLVSWLLEVIDQLIALRNLSKQLWLLKLGNELMILRKLSKELFVFQNFGG